MLVRADETEQPGEDGPGGTLRGWLEGVMIWTGMMDRAHPPWLPPQEGWGGSGVSFPSLQCHSYKIPIEGDVTLGQEGQKIR